MVWIQQGKIQQTKYIFFPNKIHDHMKRTISDNTCKWTMTNLSEIFRSLFLRIFV